MKHLIQELSRRNVFRSALSYIVVSWVFLQAAAIIFPLLNISSTILRGCLMLLIIGFPFWLIVAYIFDLTPEGIKKTEALLDVETLPTPKNDSRQNGLIIGGLALAVVLLLTDRIFNFTQISAKKDDLVTIAVLPFVNQSPEEENAFFTVGMHEDVMNKLAKLETVRVICRTSVNKYKDYEGEMKFVGDRLGADYVMEGSVRRADGQVRITAQLIDVATNQMIWSDSYDRQLDNIFELQSEIAYEIADKMQASLSPKDKKLLDQSGTVVIAAYDSYLKARNIFNESWLPYDRLMEVIDHLEDAVKIDPDFSDGWALLSQAQSNRYFDVLDFDGREAEANEAKREAQKALEKARRLTPEGLEYYKAEAVYNLDVMDDKVATLQSLSKAQDIQPDDPEVLFLQSYFGLQLGQFELALKSLERSFKLDPENARVTYLLTLAYELNRRYAEMVPFLERLLKLEPERTHYAVQAKYYQFLADGSLDSFREFETAVRTVKKTEQCDDRAIQDVEMVVALFNDDFDQYAKAVSGKWDGHHKNHGNWSCPMILNEEANHARLLVDHGHDYALADHIIDEVRSSSTRPVDENSYCIFNKEVYEPKLDLMDGDTALARVKFTKLIFDVMSNDKFPRGAVERAVLLQTADMVAPEMVYDIYRQVIEAPISMVSMESICANPWIYYNLIRDAQFIAEVKADGRFVKFLEHYGFLES